MAITSTRTGSVLVAATLVGATGVAAAPAAAAPVAVGAGTTSLTLTSATAKALKGLGVSATVIRPGSAKGATLAFPVTGGRIDPKTAVGTLNHRGGLRLKKGGRQVRLTDFRVTVGRRSTISAKVNGGARASVFALVVGKARVASSGAEARVSRLRVHLTTAGAGALNATFRTHAFRSRQLIASARTAVLPSSVELTGGSTALTLDPGTAQALTGLGVAVAPAAGATANADGSVAFPISGGRLSSRTFAGDIAHTGGLTLTAGAKTVTLKDFRIGVDSTPSLSADVGGQRVEIVDLDLADLQATLTGRRVVLDGAKATLTQTAATALNQAFGTTALKAGLPLGVATVTGTLG
jgi:hypothetical protein